MLALGDAYDLIGYAVGADPIEWFDRDFRQREPRAGERCYVVVIPRPRGIPYTLCRF